MKSLEPLLKMGASLDPGNTESLAAVLQAKTVFESGLENLAFFNRVYAPLGWTPFDAISLDLLAKLRTIDLVDGEDLLVEHFLDPTRRRPLAMRFKSRRYEDWFKILERAFERLDAQDHISAIPLLLILIDGVCQRYLQKSAFGGATDAEVFDTLTDAPNGLSHALRLAGRTRKKFSTAALEAPYRNGILHGRDVNYGHPIVAAKAVNLLYGTLDYIDRRADEEQRLAKASRDQLPPDWATIFATRARTEAISQASASWVPRLPKTEIVASYSNASGLGRETPEAAAVDFLKAICRGNFGKLAELAADYTKRSPGKWAGDLKRDYGDIRLETWTIVELRDTASAASDLKIEVSGVWQGRSWQGVADMRLLYLDEQNDSLPRSLPEGRWKVLVSVFSDIWRFAYRTAPAA